MMIVNENWIKHLISTTKAEDIPVEYIVSATISFTNGTIEKFTPEQISHVLYALRSCIAQVQVEVDVNRFVASINEGVTQVYDGFNKIKAAGPH